MAGGVALALACAAALCLSGAGCGRKPGSKVFEGIRLASLSGSGGVELSSCPTPRCLTIVVAPWCGYCRRATQFINDFARYLKGRGITTRIVVGQDDIGPVKQYAADFGPDTLLDPGGSVRVPGVPQFFVTDSEGRLLKATAGAPPIDPPFTDAVLLAVAETYGVL